MTGLDLTVNGMLGDNGADIESDTGGITFADDTIDAAGGVSDNGVNLITTSAPIRVTGLDFSTPSVLNNGVNITTTAGATTFAGDTIDIGSTNNDGFALTSTTGPISVTSLNFTVTSIVGVDGVSIATGGNVTVAGTNKIMIGGAVNDNVLNVAGANVSVANVTAKLSDDIGDGIQINARGNASVSNLKVTVVGNITENVGKGAGIDLAAGGTCDYRRRDRFGPGERQRWPLRLPPAVRSPSAAP